MSKRDLEAPEDSIPLRLIVFSMTLICVTSSCLFIRTSWGVSILTLALAIIGSLVAYQHRNERASWMQIIVLVGMLAVGANALNEFLHPMNTATDFWGPVVHFVAGTFALHTFDLKSRSDINLSALLGALILCALSPIVRGIYFGAVVFTYICLGCAMLYYDCISRTQHNWLTKPMLVAPVTHTTGGERRRRPKGSTIATMALLPLTALIVFMAVPRSDSFIDVVVSSFKSFNLNGLLRLFPFLNPQNNQGPKKNPYDPKQVKTVNLPPKNLKAEPAKNKDKDKPNAVKKEEQAKKEAEKKAKAKKDAEKKKNEKKDEPKKEHEPKKEADKKPEDKKDEEKKPEDVKPPVSKPSLNKSDKKDKKGKKGKNEKLDPKKVAEQAKKDAAKNAAKDAAKAAAAAAKKAAAKRAALAAPLSAAAASKLLADQFNNIFPDTLRLDRIHSEQLSQVLLFKVTSTRLFFPRLNAFDNFDGSMWSRSKDNINSKIVEVKSDAGPNDKPVLKDNVERDANGNPVKELSAEQEADLEIARDKFFKDAQEEWGFGADQSVHYLISKSEKSTYDLRSAQAFHVPKKVPFVDLTQSYELLVDIGKNVPNCWIPQSLGYTGSTAVVDDYGGVSFPENMKKGTTYKMTSSWPVNDLGAMRGAAPITADEEVKLRDKLANYLQVPEGIDPQVKQFGDTAIGGTGNWFVQAEKICQAVRKNSILSNDDLDAVAPPEKEAGEGAVGSAGAPGAGEAGAPAPEGKTEGGSQTKPADAPESAENSEGAENSESTENTESTASTENTESTDSEGINPNDKIADFLFGRKLGDSTRFASAFAVLCRQQGLPARVVVGFQPGTFNKISGTYEISGADAFTWAEVYVPEYGWIAFDATPDGVFPDQKRDEGYNFAAIIKAIEEQLGLNEGEGLTPKKIFAILTLLVSCVFMTAAIVYGIILLRRWLKKRQAQASWKGQEWPVYKALMKELKRIRIEREVTESQRQFVARVADITKERAQRGASVSEELPGALGDFFEVYDAMHFGNREAVSELKERAARVRILIKATKLNGSDKMSSEKAGSGEMNETRSRGKSKNKSDAGPSAADSAIRSRGPRK